MSGNNVLFIAQLWFQSFKLLLFYATESGKLEVITCNISLAVLTTVYIWKFIDIWIVYLSFLKKIDKRTDGWPLMGSPLMPFLLCQACPILFKVIGPKLMQNRPPYELRGALTHWKSFSTVACSIKYVKWRGLTATV